MFKKVQYSPAFLHSISNVDGSMSIFHVDPNNPIITLPDGTQAHVQGVVSIVLINSKLVIKYLSHIYFIPR